MRSSFLFLPLLAATVTDATVVSRNPPSTGQDWISLPDGSEFQPAGPDSVGDDEDQHRMLQQAQKRFLEEESVDISSIQQKTSFQDSQETYYDGYAQAWRMLGFYTDCGPDGYDDRRRMNKEQRKLGDDEEGGCKRVLLWAAYVDLDYSGNGIGEYQFWDIDMQAWDTSACELTGSERCAKCDCHLEDTHYKLLGFYKEPGYGAMFEQLFKHQGYCLWDNNEYGFMEELQEDWPEGCSETEVYTSDGQALYYELKPMPGANMTIGLYTDYRCSQDYMGEEYTIESLYGYNNNGDDNDGDVWQTGKTIEYWNYGMRVFKHCQPCRTYALWNTNYNNNNRKLEDNDPNNGLFQCNDDAGYTNVNQCMKFRTKTSMYYADFQDILLGSQQQSLLEVVMEGKSYGSSVLMASTEEEEEQEGVNELRQLGLSLLSFVVGALMLSKTVHWILGRRKRSQNAALNQPLI